LEEQNKQLQEALNSGQNQRMFDNTWYDGTEQTETLPAESIKSEGKKYEGGTVAGDVSQSDAVFGNSKLFKCVLLLNFSVVKMNNPLIKSQTLSRSV